VLLWLIGLHIAAVLYYLLIRKDNLIGPMLSGKRAYDGDQPAVKTGSAVLLIVGVALAGMLTWWVSRAFH
jgi:hypothetical protein